MIPSGTPGTSPLMQLCAHQVVKDRFGIHRVFPSGHARGVAAGFSPTRSTEHFELFPFYPSPVHPSSTAWFFSVGFFQRLLSRLTEPTPGKPRVPSRKDLSQVLLPTCLTSFVSRILGGSLGPVNPAREFFMSFVGSHCAEAYFRLRGPLLFSSSRALLEISRNPASCIGHRGQADSLHRSPSNHFGLVCGEEGNRTPDLLLAKQALYQLSYFPSYSPPG